MLLYRFLSVLVLAAYSPYALLRSLAGRRRLGDIRGRLGLSPYPDLDGGIWVHAVSVGEVRVARQLLGALARKAPGARLGLSVTTAAGRRLAERDAQAASAVFAFPLDLARPVERSLATVRPGLVLLTETEIWPLFLDRAAARGIPVALVNGRISGRSFGRYALARRFLARTLGKVSLFAMQTEEDAERIARLGAPPERIRVTGNIKYDLAAAPPFADAARLKGAASGRPVVVAASTADGEEAIVLEAWKRLSPRPLLAIAPRRPERFDDVARLVDSSGFTLLRRTSPDPASPIQNPKSKIQNPLRPFRHDLPGDGGGYHPAAAAGAERGGGGRGASAQPLADRLAGQRPAFAAVDPVLRLDGAPRCPEPGRDLQLRAHESAPDHRRSAPGDFPRRGGR